MSVIGSNILAGASGQGGDYTIARSLRLRSSASAYLNRTPSSAGNRKTWTWSAWVKRGTIGGNSFPLFSVYGAGDDTGFLDIKFYQDTLVVDGWSANFVKTTQLFRDPSSWYHLVVAMDTTQATASNRLKVYVNGTQVTSFSSTSYPTQNADTGINGAFEHKIGNTPSSSSYFDGYLTEINFISGQQLTPSSFGANNASTGVWQPKKYAGTYGTNGFYLPFTDNTQYYSGLFNGSSQTAYVGYNSVLNLGTSDYTVEAFVNPTSLSNGNGQQQVLGRWVDGSDRRSYLLGINNDGSVFFATSTNGLSGSGNSITVTSSAGVITTNTWSHIRVSQSGGTVYLGINGTIVTSATNSIFSNVYTSTDPVALGASQQGNTATLFTGRISNVRIIKGTALSTSSYTVPTAPLTAVSGTSLLTLQSSTLIDNSGNSLTITDPSSNPSISTVAPTSFGGLGKDFSGTGNNWTTNNISLTAGATYDSMTDVPTNTSATAANFAVLNPIQAGPVGSGTLSNANLTLTDGSRNGTIFYPSSGKYYTEVNVTNDSIASGGLWFGVFVRSADYVIYKSDGSIEVNGSSVATVSTYTTGDVVAMTANCDSNEMKFYKNNTLQHTRTYTFTDKPFTLYCAGSSIGDANFGQRPFAYTPPTGFVALNTYNLPTPTIGATASTQANKYFDATAYTGNGSTRSITNSGSMQPDLVWIKDRTSANWHIIEDAVRGTNVFLSSNTTYGDATLSGSVTAFNSNGFSLGTDGNVNTNSNAYVGWQWKGGNGTVSNTAGSITSTVSANTSAGFSVVTWTGNGSTATIGHGLGVAPKMIILKERNLNNEWFVYTQTTGAGNKLNLNSTAAVTTSTIWNSTAPTSTVFSTGPLANTTNAVAYCFAEVSGYSRFGGYTGNGSSDGTFVYTGFRPKYVMYKRTDGVADWVVMDSSRQTTNVVGSYLLPNSSVAEGYVTIMDFTSNGFKLRSGGSGINGNGETYIYMAFAENPFKYSLAR